MWAKEYECCQECGTTEREHIAKGLCTICYRKRRYHEQKKDPEFNKNRYRRMDKEKVAACKARFLAAHPDYYKTYVDRRSKVQPTYRRDKYLHRLATDPSWHADKPIKNRKRKNEREAAQVFFALTTVTQIIKEKSV